MNKVNFAVITLYIAYQRVIPNVSLYFVIDSVRKLLDTPSDVSAATMSISVLGPNEPPIQWIPEALSPGVKRPGREADHSPPSSAEFKNAWSYNSTPP
jgi:hypothetical protein